VVKVGSGPKLTEILHVFGPPIFSGERPPNFWSGIIKLGQIPIMWQSFRAIGRGSSENAWRKKLRQNISPSGTVVPGGLIMQFFRGGFNGRPLVQWPTGLLALEAPGVGPARRTMEEEKYDLFNDSASESLNRS